MKPYFQRDGITLYHGDCAEVKVECDLLVTDPPYGQKYESGWSNKWGTIEGDDDVGGTIYRLRHSIGSLRRHRHVYIFGNILPLKELPLCGFAEIIWDKGVMGMGNLASPWGLQHETINFAIHEYSAANRKIGRGGLSARLRKGSVIRSLRPNSARIVNHPTEKPVDILRQLIESSSIIGEVVYDPFAGSGSTLIATAIEGRQAIGCEIEERYCEIAAKRIERELHWEDIQMKLSLPGEDKS